MPIYEFVCEACGRLTEVMQKLSDPAPSPCPECGQGPMARTVSRTSFQLKGGGWYADLYASKKEKPAPGAKPEAGGGEASGGKPAPTTAAPAGAPAGAPSGAPAKPAASAPSSAPAASSGGSGSGGSGSAKAD